MFWHASVLTLILTACGARTGLGAPVQRDGGAEASVIDAESPDVLDAAMLDEGTPDAFQLTVKPAIGAGTERTCAVLASGELRCWGSNTYGALGDGTMTNRLMPVHVALDRPAVATGSGTWSTCALLDDGTARCWGNNSVGQLGNGGLGSQSLTAVPVTSLSQASLLTVNGYQACTLVGGVVECWGELGPTGANTHTTPITIALNGVAIQVATGITFSCFLIGDGTVECLGINDSGQLGDGTDQDRANPAPVVALSGVARIGVGAQTACAIQNDGRVQCWGDNSFGLLGDGSIVDHSPSPVFVSGITDATQVAIGSQTACVLRKSGHVVCWGMNKNGEVGDGTTIDRPLPTEVIGLSDVVQIAAAWHHACALLSNDQVKCWGANGGALGNGTIGNSSVPVDVIGIP